MPSTLKKRFPTPGLAAILLLAFASPATMAEPASTSLVLLTLDTTRADALGAYGSEAETPALDALARRGTRYARALTSAPLTLPAHASLLTGLEATRHGILDNGTASLDPNVATLATVLAERGYRTGAFVASRVLDRRFGLGRGFELYDDLMTAEHLGEYGYPERDAAAVTTAALAWLEGLAPRELFFLWVHYYDPHAPYAAPSVLGTERQRYAGEVAYMDREIGRLLDAVAGRGAAALVAAVGDHGEALGEHGERTHGIFLYRSTLEVPLVLAGPGVGAGRVVEETVAARRLAPTLLGLLGVDSLLPGTVLPGLPALGQDPPPEPVYSATWMPASAYGWARLAAVSDQRWRLVRAPRPELYDFVADPAETKNLVAEKRGEAQRLAAELEAFEEGLDARRPPPAELDAGLAADLRSLGYVSSGPPSEEGTLDPKDGVRLLDEFERAKELVSSGRIDEGRARLADLVERNPRNVPFLRRLAGAQLTSGRVEEALKTFARAIELNPRLDFLHLSLGETCQQLGRLDDARAAYRRTLELNPRAASAWLGLAEMAARAGDAAEERRLLEQAVEVGTGSAAIRLRLGQVAAAAGEASTADAHLATAVELAPQWALAWLLRGQVLLASGRLKDARPCLERAVALAPHGAEGREARRLLQGL